MHKMQLLLVVLFATAAIWGLITVEATAPRAGASDVRPAGGFGQPPPAAFEDGISVYFSPDGGGTQAIIAAIGNAGTSVHVQAAQFTSGPIADALIAARAKGVAVRVLLDRDKNKDDDSQAPRLARAGVPTFTDNRHETAHNKVMIVDGRLVITGSFNFTPDAESRNAENLVFIDGKPKLAAAYEANFRDHLAHAKPYKKK